MSTSGVYTRGDTHVNTYTHFYMHMRTHKRDKLVMRKGRQTQGSTTSLDTDCACFQGLAYRHVAPVCALLTGVHLCPSEQK